MSRVRIGEETSDWVPLSDTVDLGKAGLSKLLARYDEINDQIIPQLVEERDAIKALMKQFGTDYIIAVNGVETYRVRQDGQLKTREFAKAYPGYAKDCTVIKEREVIDPALVRQVMGDVVWKRFLTQKIEKINKK